MNESLDWTNIAGSINELKFYVGILINQTVRSEEKLQLPSIENIRLFEEEKVPQAQLSPELQLLKQEVGK